MCHVLKLAPVTFTFAEFVEKSSHIQIQAPTREVLVLPGE
jgi:hypothetical protein